MVVYAYNLTVEKLRQEDFPEASLGKVKSSMSGWTK